MSDILLKRDGAVLEIRFNRPAKKNAITNEMYGVMADAIETAEEDGDIRAILFTAEGDFFSAGNDLMDFAAQSSGAFSGPRHVGRFLENMLHAQKPIVAAVTGNGVGVGTTMLLHCDLVYIAEGAKLTTPFIDLGLVPENASSMTIVDRLGHARLRCWAWASPCSARTPPRSASPTPRCPWPRSSPRRAARRTRWRRSRPKPSASPKA